MVTDPPRGSSAAILTLAAGGVPSLAELLVLSGDVLWLVTYVLAIRVGFRDRAYALPLVAIALNVSWELIYGILHPPDSTVARVLHGTWFVLDVIIVWQAYHYGRSQQTEPVIRRNYPAIFAGMLVLAFAGQALLREQALQSQLDPDVEGLLSAYIINAVASLLFLFFLAHRNNPAGLSRGIAWTKCLATGVISVGLFLASMRAETPMYEIQIRPIGGMAWQSLPPRELISVVPDLLWYLALTVFLFDVLYIILLYRWLRRYASGGGGPAPATPG